MAKGRESCGIEYFRERLHPGFFEGTMETVQSSGSTLDRWENGLAVRGQSALSHTFEYGGFGPVQLGTAIDWTADPYSSDSKPNERGWHPDLRVIWELNRCAHFAVLGLAYNASREESYVVEILAQMRHWGDSNTFGSGPNWKSSMEASIRIINWSWAFFLIRDSKQLSDDVVTRFLAQVSAHGFYIYRNLERSSTSNNHYLAGGIGLLHLGVLFPELRESKRWLRTGKRVTFSEVLNQTLPDGAGFEGSIPYHGLVLEMVLPAIILCRKNGIDVPEGVLRRVEHMLEFVSAYTRHDGSYPQFGDRDDGHLLSVADRSIDSHRHVLAIGAVLFRRSDFKAASGGWDLEAELLLGKRGRAQFDDLSRCAEDASSQAFLEGGYFFMRHDHAHMAIDCADVGLNGRGGHGHNDCLSFQLHAHGRNLLIDSGTLQYAVPEATRRLFQCTSAHNTATVDDKEIARFVAGNIWGISDEADPSAHFWHSTEGYDAFEGSHSGYLRLDDPVRHVRRIIFNKHALQWVIVDRFLGKQQHDFKIYFHLSPGYLGLVSVLDNGRGIRTNDSYGPNFALFALGPQEIDISVYDGVVSQRYGHSETAPVVSVAAKGGAPWSVEFCLCLLAPGKQDFCVDSSREIAMADVAFWNARCPPAVGDEFNNVRRSQ